MTSLITELVGTRLRQTAIFLAFCDVVQKLTAEDQYLPIRALTTGNAPDRPVKSLALAVLKGPHC